MSDFVVRNRLTPNGITKAGEKKVAGTAFSDFLKEELLVAPRAQIVQAENLVTQAALNPSVSKLQLVAALTEAEIELQKMTTIFTKAQESYDKILHMPL
ncbi:MAG: flagellar hook-basal body complex protein FliE [Holosporales bacterium]|jgi:flagellar hook-basal body complex protein FliE|nr:flagellar hook-basal body complex protein FliE [Holosporales bacterium]